MAGAPGPVLYTIGHGARSAAEFVSLLQQAGVTTLVDVRAYPVSRRHPQFSRPRLSEALRSAGIAYEWQGKALGGMRRSYVEHMATDSFQQAAHALTGRTEPVCIMC